MPKLGEIVKGKDISYQSCGNNRYIWQACPDCHKEKWVMLSRAKKQGYQIRCRLCSAQKRGKEEKASGANIGSNNPQWKGGRQKTLAGYIRVFISPDSPYYSMRRKVKGRASNDILEHRLIMAHHLGRCLYSWEVIHHLNGIKSDNRVENLYLVNRETHKTNTRLKALEKEVRLLQWQVKILTGRLNEAGIPLPSNPDG